jgi:hypothetical protein
MKEHAGCARLASKPRSAPLHSDIRYPRGHQLCLEEDPGDSSKMRTIGNFYTAQLFATTFDAE